MKKTRKAFDKIHQKKNKRRNTMTLLDELKKHTTVVADTGDFSSIAKYTPTDATTNPSLILSAALLDQYAPLVEEAIVFAKKTSNTKKMQIQTALERIFVNFGFEILQIIPGRVSIEVDARLSFDKKKSIEKARRIIQLFEERNIPRTRILIKLASTWECILAAKELEKENIHCNMTLLFSLTQAIACAEAKATLISPFVGRILDWHKKKLGVDTIPAEKDPGVLSVKNIYHYYKKFGYKTQIMGASFRNIEEILQLTGCDLLTISPKLLEELKNRKEPLQSMLNQQSAQTSSHKKISIDKKLFHQLLEKDKMASEKLIEGINLFSKDIEKLEDMIKEKIS